MQTKYTGLVVPGWLLIYAFFHGRLRYAAVAAALAFLVFIGWEVFIAAHYDQSHFLYHLSHHPQIPKTELLGPFVKILGCVAPLLAVVALLALRFPGWIAWVGISLAAVQYAFVALFPQLLGVPLFASSDPMPVNILDGIYGAMGIVVCVSLAAVAARLLQGRGRGQDAAAKDDIVVVLWVVLEIVASFALAPFPAVRRIMGLVIAATLLVGRLASRKGTKPLAQRGVTIAAVGSACFGLLFFGLDYLEARAEKVAAETAAARIRAIQPDATIWYVGYWGFQFYAEREGMKQVIPMFQPETDRMPYPVPSLLRAGDFLVIPFPPIPRQAINEVALVQNHVLRKLDAVQVVDGIPLQTGGQFYGGGYPLSPLVRPRVVAVCTRVQKDFIPRSGP